MIPAASACRFEDVLGRLQGGSDGRHKSYELMSEDRHGCALS